MINNTLLKGKQVWLTALNLADAATIARWELDSEFIRLLDALPAHPRSEDEIARWLENSRKSRNDFLFGIRLIDSQELIGWLELDGVLWTHQVCGLGIAIGDRAYWGRGYGSEAVQLALQFVFHELNLYRVQLTVFSYNERAIGLYEKLGFQREGVHREHIQRDGRRYDMLLYGLLRPEWEVRNARSAGWRTGG